MAYTDDLKHLIKKVEETRPQRIAKKKEDRLRKFHPSYKEGSLQELKVGPHRRRISQLFDE